MLLGLLTSDMYGHILNILCQLLIWFYDEASELEGPVQYPHSCTALFRAGISDATPGICWSHTGGSTTMISRDHRVADFYTSPHPF